MAEILLPMTTYTKFKEYIWLVNTIYDAGEITLSEINEKWLQTEISEGVAYHNEEDGEDYRIGYIPREDNETIASILEMGWTDMFECRISKINEEAHSENQIHMTIKIKRNKNSKKEE